MPPPPEAKEPPPNHAKIALEAAAPDKELIAVPVLAAAKVPTAQVVAAGTPHNAIAAAVEEANATFPAVEAFISMVSSVLMSNLSR